MSNIRKFIKKKKEKDSMRIWVCGNCNGKTFYLATLYGALCEACGAKTDVELYFPNDTGRD